MSFAPETKFLVVFPAIPVEELYCLHDVVLRSAKDVEDSEGLSDGPIELE
jgi:hypothetical protein